jgi:hypothetical protein
MKLGDKIMVRGLKRLCRYLMKDKRFSTMSWITMPWVKLPIMVQDTMIKVVK